METEVTMAPNHPFRRKSSSKDLTRSRLSHTTIDFLPLSNFYFHQPKQVQVFDKPRTLLVLFAWLFSRERHIDKFRALYLDRGFDVLSVRVNLRDFLIPKSGAKQTAVRLMRFLSEHSEQYDSIIFHAFSIGSYQMGELMMLLDQEGQLNCKIQPLIKGIIYDSPVDVNLAAQGVARGATSNPFLQWSIASLMKGHLKLFHSMATRHYINASEIQRENRDNYPILMFLSKDDAVTKWEHMFDIMDKWREGGATVWYKCWDESPHVSHYYKYPEEYREKLDKFLRNVAKIDYCTTIGE